MVDSVIEQEYSDVITQSHGENWQLYNADCVEAVGKLPTESVGFSVFSPPFASLYTYSNSERDMGNCKSDAEFWAAFGFLVEELLRVTKPGRLISVHCMQMPRMKGRDGFLGIRDFRGEIVQLFERIGFHYHSEVCIWKDPVTQMQRTKAIGLLHKQVCKDSTLSRQGLADYVCTFRKPGDNAEPVAGEFDHFAGDHSTFKSKGRLSIDIWQRYASPVWMDINPSNTLQYTTARDEADERHICLAKGSLVLTKAEGHKPIEDIAVGDLVLTHKGRWRSVIAKEKTAESADVVSVKAQGVHSLCVTPTHSIWARKTNGKKRLKDAAKRASPEWVHAEDLEKCYVNLKLPPIENDSRDSQFWWMVGRWLADGHRGKRGCVYVSIGKGKHQEFIDNAGDYVGSSCERTATQYRINDPNGELRKVLDKCGKRASNKKLPPEAFTLSPELSMSLLDGYLSGDGYYHEGRKRWYTTSVSRELLLGLKFIIQRVDGTVASIHAGRGPRDCVIEGRTVKAKQDWSLTWGGLSHSFSFTDNDGAWKKVKSVKPAGQAETWNIRVDEDESYTAEGCVVKNCPLQLDVIERCVQLWSNPGDVVLSPFAGIGSEGHVAVKLERKFVGVELKPSYYRIACKNMRAAEASLSEQRLF